MEPAQGSTFGERIPLPVDSHIFEEPRLNSKIIKGMLTYSVAIRTLGTAGDKFRQELESLKTQTLQPDRILVYIAEGYARPPFQVGREEYVWVPKGMVASSPGR